MKKKMVLGLTTLLFTVGCGSIATRKVNKTELEGVRKVALVSFDAVLPSPSSFELDMSSKQAGISGEQNIAIPQESPEADHMYADLAKAFEKRAGWKVLSLSEMKSNIAYKNAYDSKMKGWQQKMPVRGEHYLISDVMDSMSVFRMRQAERDHLIKALGVDAIVEARVNVHLKINGVSVMGFANRYPQAHVSFTVYKNGVEEPVWFDGVEGEASTESVGKTGFFDIKKVEKLGRLSAQTAFSRISATE